MKTARKVRAAVLLPRNVRRRNTGGGTLENGGTSALHSEVAGGQNELKNKNTELIVL